MKLNKYQIAGKNRLKKEAWEHYKKGLSLRKIGALLNKSHEWVRLALKSYTQ